MPLLSLPTEILGIIVKMVRNQDEAFWKRMEIARPSVASANALLSTGKGDASLGRSLRSLSLSAKVFGDLTRAHIFETVSLRHIVQSRAFYWETIEPRYRQYVKHIILDIDQESPEHPTIDVLDYMAELIISAIAMPQLRHLTFFYERAIQDVMFLNSIARGVRLPLPKTQWHPEKLQISFDFLKERITDLTIHMPRRMGSISLFLLFPHTRHLERIAGAVQLMSMLPAVQVEAEGSAMAALPCLETLDLNMIPAKDQKRFHLVEEIGDIFYQPIPASWSAEGKVWHSATRTLRLTTEYVGQDEFKFISLLHKSLCHLSISCLGTLPQPFHPLPPPSGVVFTSLTSLHLNSMSRALVLLSYLAGAPLEHIDLELHDLNNESCDNLTSLDPKTNPLSPFATTLKTLRIVRSRGSQPPSYQATLSKYCTEVGLVHRPDALKDHEVFYEMCGVRSERDELVITEQVDVEEMVDASTELMEYAKARLKMALEMKDKDRINEIATLLRPFAAMKLLEQD